MQEFSGETDIRCILTNEAKPISFADIPEISVHKLSTYSPIIPQLIPELLLQLLTP